MTEAGEEAGAVPARRRGLSGTIWALEHAQDYLTVVVGVVLIVLAAALIIFGVASFFPDMAKHGVFTAATNLLDRVLLVLILVEIVHTVVLSLRAHRLIAQPFIVVGLVAVIRRILFVLSNEEKISNAELGLLIAMVVVFVAGLIAVSRFEQREELPPAVPSQESAGSPRNR
jgi:uncharacterized membrane protein (DUF373 family)